MPHSNPECKVCGLLKSTISAQKYGDKWFLCKGNVPHDFGESTNYSSPNPEGFRICMNGHQMTGIGFDQCPECEAPWVSGKFNVPTPEIHEKAAKAKEIIERWEKMKTELNELDEMEFAASRDAIFTTVDNLLTSQRRKMVEKLDGMKITEGRMLKNPATDFRRCDDYNQALSDAITALEGEE